MPKIQKPSVEESGAAAFERVVHFKLEKITPGAVRYFETTATGGKKPSTKAHIRTLYIRKDALPKDDSEAGCVAPDMLKVTITQV